MYNADDVEKVSNVLHEMWIEWTKFLCADQYYSIPTHIRNFWANNWKPYYELPQKEKDKDIQLAKRILEALER